jgi:hypothetical protein
LAFRLVEEGGSFDFVRLGRLPMGQTGLKNIFAKRLNAIDSSALGL